MKRFALFALPMGLCLVGILSCSDNPTNTDDPPDQTITATLRIKGEPAAVNCASVDLLITGTNATRMMLSNRADFDGASWQPFVEVIFGWALDAGEGTKTIHARFDNDAQVGMVTRSVSVVLDQTPPDVSGLVAAPADGAADVAGPVPLSWTGAFDALSGIAEYRVEVNRHLPCVTEIYRDSTEACFARDLTPSILYYWQVTAIDAGGNEATAGPWSFTTGTVGYILDAIPIPPIEIPVPITYEMGGSGGGGVPHDVTLTRRFYMAETEVTEAAWDEVTGDGNSTSRKPQAYVFWIDAIEFCNALSDLEGLPRAYIVGETAHDVTRVEDSPGWRLPTEAEWELACRAGTDTRFNTGTCLAAENEANYNGSDPFPGCPEGTYPGQSVRVGSYPPNAWGLYDMHGNVWEWCYDYYREDYESLPSVDPVQEDMGMVWVLRGGGWFSGAEYCRSAARYHYYPEGALTYRGVRPVRTFD